MVHTHHNDNAVATPARKIGARPTPANDNIAPGAEPVQPEAKKFVSGQDYSCRSACDYGTVFTYTVTRRTEKSIWVKGQHDDVAKRVKVQTDSNGEEWALPSGRYSMCPVIRP